MPNPPDIHELPELSPQESIAVSWEAHWARSGESYPGPGTTTDNKRPESLPDTGISGDTNKREVQRTADSHLGERLKSHGHSDVLLRETLGLPPLEIKGVLPVNANAAPEKPKDRCDTTSKAAKVVWDCPVKIPPVHTPRQEGTGTNKR